MDDDAWVFVLTNEGNKYFDIIWRMILKLNHLVLCLMSSALYCLERHGKYDVFL